MYNVIITARQLPQFIVSQKSRAVSVMREKIRSGTVVSNVPCIQHTNNCTLRQSRQKICDSMGVSCPIPPGRIHNIDEKKAYKFNFKRKPPLKSQRTKWSTAVRQRTNSRCY